MSGAGAPTISVDGTGLRVVEMAAWEAEQVSHGAPAASGR